MSKLTQEIVNSVLDFLKKEDTSETAFNDQALRLFHYQYRNNLPYQMYCRQKGKTPRMVKAWRDIPSVPINAFKELTLSCEDPDIAEDVFMTSGTTRGIRGKHYHQTLEVYDTSMLINFKERFMNGNDRIRMGILFPTEEEMPNSSLSHYLALAYKECGTSNSRYLVDNEGLQIEQLLTELEDAENNDEPYGLLGATFSFVHLFEELQKREKSFQLPKGSRILDTGGFKNKSKELDLETFYSQLWAIKGVDAGEGTGNRVELAQSAAKKLNTTVIITGKDDVVTDGQNTYIVHNGHSILTKVTGTGCLLSSVIGAFSAVENDLLLASVAALATYGVASEIAAKQTEEAGPGSFQIEFLNQLSKVSSEDIRKFTYVDKL